MFFLDLMLSADIDSSLPTLGFVDVARFLSRLAVHTETGQVGKPYGHVRCVAATISAASLAIVCSASGAET
jgi:hypothetical protein